MKIEENKLSIGRTGVANYPIVTVEMTVDDYAQGFFLEVEVAEIAAVATDVALVVGFGDESYDTIGNSFFDVNAGAGAASILGPIVFDFTVLTKARVTVKPGSVVVGAFTYPANAAPVCQFVFKDAALKIIGARVTKRMGGAK